jgi:hypothetical protein
LRRARTDIGLLAATPDGALLATADFGELIYRLAPGAASWTVHFSLAQLPRRAVDPGYSHLNALTDGGFAFSAYELGTWRVGAAGDVQRVRVPRGWDARALAALPVATLGMVLRSKDLSREAFAIAPPAGRPAVVWRPARDSGGLGPLVALLEGGFATVPEHVSAFGPDGGLLADVGAEPRLGNGDGGPPAVALLRGTALALLPDGVLALSDDAAVGSERARFDLPTELGWRGRALADPLGQGPVRLVRALAPAGSARPLAAFGEATYRTLAGGSVELLSTFAGRAVLTVSRGGRTVARAAGDVIAGPDMLRLPAPIPPGDYRLTAEVTGADGRVAGARLAVTTVRRLERARGLRLLRRWARSMESGDGGGYYGMDVGGCRRQNERELRCRAIEYRGSVAGERRGCAAVFVATLRADGVRARLAGGRRACRALLRRA